MLFFCIFAQKRGRLNAAACDADGMVNQNRKSTALLRLAVLPCTVCGLLPCIFPILVHYIFRRPFACFAGVRKRKAPRRSRLGSVDNQRCGGVFGKKYPPAASKMLARCPTLLCFFPCIRAFFTQKTVSQAECQQTLGCSRESGCGRRFRRRRRGRGGIGWWASRIG